MAWLTALVRTDATYLQWVMPLMLAGTGISMAMPAVQSAVLAEVEPADIGKAAGLFNTLRQLGGVFGVALVVQRCGRRRGYELREEVPGGAGR